MVQTHVPSTVQAESSTGCGGPSLLEASKVRKPSCGLMRDQVPLLVYDGGKETWGESYWKNGHSLEVAKDERLWRSRMSRSTELIINNRGYDTLGSEVCPTWQGYNDMQVAKVACAHWTASSGKYEAHRIHAGENKTESLKEKCIKCCRDFSAPPKKCKPEAPEQYSPSPAALRYCVLEPALLPREDPLDGSLYTTYKVVDGAAILDTYPIGTAAEGLRGHLRPGDRLLYDHRRPAVPPKARKASAPALRLDQLDSLSAVLFRWTDTKQRDLDVYVWADEEMGKELFEPPPDPTLPAGWVRRVTPAGVPEYFNEGTQEVRQDHPGLAPARAALTTAGLTAGWVAVPDPSNGTSYFWQPSTGAALPHGEKPAGWVAVPDPKSGEAYFWEPTTGASQWDPPTPAAAAGQGGASTQGAAAVAGQAALPAGWVKRTDPSDGSTEYFNTDHKVLQSKRPTSLGVAPPPPPPGAPAELIWKKGVGRKEGAVTRPSDDPLSGVETPLPPAMSASPGVARVNALPPHAKTAEATEVGPVEHVGLTKPPGPRRPGSGHRGVRTGGRGEVPDGHKLGGGTVGSEQEVREKRLAALQRQAEKPPGDALLDLGATPQQDAMLQKAQRCVQSTEPGPCEADPQCSWDHAGRLCRAKVRWHLELDGRRPQFVVRFNGMKWCVYRDGEAEDPGQCDGEEAPCPCGPKALFHLRPYTMEHVDYDPGQLLIAWQGDRGRHRGGLKYAVEQELDGSPQALERGQGEAVHHVYPVACVRDKFFNHEGTVGQLFGNVCSKPLATLRAGEVRVRKQEDVVLLGVMQALALAKPTTFFKAAPQAETDRGRLGGLAARALPLAALFAVAERA